MQFIDEVKILIKSGDGGAGCVSFRREANVPMGGPDGGNGGKGSDIVFKTVSNLNTLIDFRYKQHFYGAKGEHGMGRNRSGLSRDPMIIGIPIGTQIFAEDGETKIMDLDQPDQEITLLRGGDGGFGNAWYKSSTNQAPRKITPGFPGQEMWVWLRLKLLSDVGLVGFPNAGKSTFLAATTRAKPKIADYPFTTLKPQLGVSYVDDKEIVIADIPGLIEGAHEGVGLGIQFLKHIERCKVILHLIDSTEDDVVDRYQKIRHELAEYSQILSVKTEVIALNKADAMLEDELNEKVALLEEYTGKKVFVISGVTGFNCNIILRELFSKF